MDENFEKVFTEEILPHVGIAIVTKATQLVADKAKECISMQPETLRFDVTFSGQVSVQVSEVEVRVSPIKIEMDVRHEVDSKTIVVAAGATAVVCAAASWAVEAAFKDDPIDNARQRS